MSSPTVAEYIVERLYKLGIEDCFGAPGDFAFPLNNAIVKHPSMNWLGFSNELNAAYAADGYARVRGGASMICTTYAVGEFSALNGVMGAKAERSAIFHLVGMPSMAYQQKHMHVHHTLGDGVFQNFINISAQTACCHAVITPDNCKLEMERLISVAMANRQPAYMIVAEDYATMPVTGPPVQPIEPKSDPAHLKAAVEAVVAKVNGAKTGAVLPAFTISRYGLQAQVKALIEATGLPFATTGMDKAVISEAHPNFMGPYIGKFSAPHVVKAVEASDVVINAGGVLFTDFATAAFAHTIKPNNMITIGIDSTEVDGHVYSNVRMQDVFAAVTPQLKKFSGAVPSQRPTQAELVGAPNDAISAASLYPQYQRFLKPNDIVIVESGTSSMGCSGLLFPEGAVYHNQTLWASIGWATGAALGAAIADRSRRVVLITGEGSHQMCANEIGNFYRHGVKPVIFVLNNNGYGIERALEDYPDWVYNDLAKWNYHTLPAALGCKDWYTDKVKTNAELQAAMDKASKADTACYIEVVGQKHDYPPAAKLLNTRMAELYGIYS